MNGSSGRGGQNHDKQSQPRIQSIGSFSWTFLLLKVFLVTYLKLQLLTHSKHHLRHMRVWSGSRVPSQIRNDTTRGHRVAWVARNVFTWKICADANLSGVCKTLFLFWDQKRKKRKKTLYLKPRLFINDRRTAWEETKAHVVYKVKSADFVSLECGRIKRKWITENKFGGPWCRRLKTYSISVNKTSKGLWQSLSNFRGPWFGS